LELIRKEHPFEADQVQQVTVQLASAEAAIVNNREIPDICLQHMVAVMLLDKTVSFKSAHDKTRMQDKATLQQREKVKLIPDDHLESLMPVRVAIVDVILADGTHLSRRVDNVRGTPQNPMMRDEVIAKARDLVAPVLGATKCTDLINAVFRLESVKDIRELRPLLQPA
jgi:2-methylcitrate dehydratase PrpD